MRWMLFAVAAACTAAAPSRDPHAPAAGPRAPAPTPAAAPAGPAAPADETERRVFEMINDERARGGLPALAWDERLAAVARVHAAEMAAQGVVSHESAVSGTVRERVRAAGVGASLVLENVGRSASLETMHRDLMRRGRSANIMSAAATRVAIGVGRRGAELFVTQLFVRDQPAIDARRVARGVRDALADAYDTKDDADLAWIAGDFARGLAAGRTRDAMWPQIRSRITQIDRRYERIEDLVTVVADVELLELPQLVGATELDVIGVGAAQGAHPQLGDGAVWIVVLNGRRLGR